jgi:putative protease
MGRKPTLGYFPGPHPQDALTPHHSGNVGKFLGKVRSVRGQLVGLQLQDGLNRGDRLRLHQEESGDRQAFSLKSLRIGNRVVESARAGETVLLECPGRIRVGDSLFKVDLAGRRSGGTGAIHPEKFAGRGGGGKQFATRIRRISAALFEVAPQSGTARGPKRERPGGGRRPPQLPLWVKSEELSILRQRFPPEVERLVLVLTPQVMAGFARVKVSPALTRRLVWALPPLIDQERVGEYRRMIAALIGQGFRDWQVAHLGQLEFFAGLDCRLSGDYRLNVLNSLAARFWRSQGVAAGQIAIETDRPNLSDFLGHPGFAAVGMTVYGFPPLFTSRFVGTPLQYGRGLVSPRGEGFVLRQAWGYTLALADQPFSLLHRLGELAGLGLDYGVVDLSGVPLAGRALAEIFGLIGGRGGGRAVSSFNFDHQLG